MKDKYKTLITSCWVVLLCCFIVKLLGGNFFVIVCENEKFIKFCEYCNTGVMYWVIALITYTTSGTLIFMAICKCKKPNLLFVISNIVFTIIKLLFLKYSTIIFIVELFYFILIPIIYNKIYWKRAIIGFILTLAFQIISLVTKNIGIKIMNNDLITQLIFMIDYYIMLVLYWLYSIKEEENQHGSFRFFLFRFRRQRKHQ